MLVKGSKIKLVKEIPGVSLKIGDVYEVSNVDESGTITFECKYGRGVMSYEEFNKHFEVKKTLEWTEEKKIVVDGRVYWYRTNGRQVVVKKLGIKAKAKCHKDDKFDLTKGLTLAIARWKFKVAKNELEKITKKL